jgi:hypothetical protein
MTTHTARRNNLNRFLIASALLSSIAMPIASVRAQSLNYANPEVSVHHTTLFQQGSFIIAQTASLTGEREDEVRSKCYMHTKITISNNGGGNGSIKGETKTWTSSKFRGFTGGVEVALLDQNKNVLYVTELQKYGVNGRALPGDSNRTETWQETLPQGVVDKVYSYAIHQRHTPTDRLKDLINKVTNTYNDIKPIIDVLVEVFKQESKS